MAEPVEPALAIAGEPQALLRFTAPHDALEYLLAAHDDAHRTPYRLRSNRSGYDLFADAEFRAEPAADIARDEPYLFLVHAEAVGQFGDVVVQHLQRSVEGDLVAIPFGNGCMRLHRGGRMPFGRNFEVGGMIGARHRMRKIALIDGLVLLLFGFDVRRIERSPFLLAIFDGEVLGRIARLLETFGDDHGDGLAPIIDLPGVLLRGLVGGALRRTRGQALVVDHRQHARHCERGVLVDRDDFAAHDRGGDEHTFSQIFDRIFGCIGRSPGDLGKPFDPGDGLAEHALLHGVEEVGRVGLVLLEMGGHNSVSVASASTAASVRRASGILKSFSP